MSRRTGYCLYLVVVSTLLMDTLMVTLCTKLPLYDYGVYGWFLKLDPYSTPISFKTLSRPNSSLDFLFLLIRFIRPSLPVRSSTVRTPHSFPNVINPSLIDPDVYLYIFFVQWTFFEGWCQ